MMGPPSRKDGSIIILRNTICTLKPLLFIADIRLMSVALWEDGAASSLNLGPSENLFVPKIFVKKSKILGSKPQFRKNFGKKI